MDNGAACHGAAAMKDILAVHINFGANVSRSVGSSLCSVLGHLQVSKLIHVCCLQDPCNLDQTTTQVYGQAPRHVQDELEQQAFSVTLCLANLRRSRPCLTMPSQLMKCRLPACGVTPLQVVYDWINVRPMFAPPHAARSSLPRAVGCWYRPSGNHD